MACRVDQRVYEQSGVKISGKGAIDGDGKIWWDAYWKLRRDDYEPRGPALGRGLRLEAPAPHPNLQIVKCRFAGIAVGTVGFLDRPHLLIRKR